MRERAADSFWPVGHWQILDWGVEGWERGREGGDGQRQSSRGGQGKEHINLKFHSQFCKFFNHSFPFYLI